MKDKPHYGRMELPQGKRLADLSISAELKALLRLRRLPNADALYKGTLEGESSWADGIILGLDPMPEQWQQQWDSWEQSGSLSAHCNLDMDGILPREPGQPMVALGTLSESDFPTQFFSDKLVVLIAEDGTPVTLKARYVAYFLKRFGPVAFEYYPTRETIRPIGVFSNGKRVGLIMPVGGQARGAPSSENVSFISRKWGIHWENQK